MYTNRPQKFVNILFLVLLIVFLVGFQHITGITLSTILSVF